MNPRWARLIWAIIACGTFTYVVLQNGWIADDAQITLRTVQQVWHGNGLVWNALERVQAYTHPLWMLILLPFGWLDATQLSIISIVLGALCSVAALMLASKLLPRLHSAIFWICMILVPSKAIIDYATSGLENSLAYLILTGLVWYASQDAWESPKRRIGFVLICSLLLLVRIDFVFFVLPLVAMAYRRHSLRQWRSIIRELACGFFPVVAWHSFTLVYYGSLVPNTAVAKLGASLPLSWYLERAGSYWNMQVAYDPYTLVLILTGILLALWRRSHAPILLPLAIGILMYCVYLTSIGGDFMLGRFFALPAWAAVLCGICALGTLRRAWIALPIYALSLLVLSPILAPRSPLLHPLDVHMDDLSTKRTATNAIVDEARYYCRRGQCLTHPEGLHLPTIPPLRSPSIVPSIGAAGLQSPVTTHIIDPLGLADPLLARMPASRPSDAAIGHIGRDIPEGYALAAVTGEDGAVSGKLGNYVNIVHTATRAPIGSATWASGVAQLTAYPTYAQYHDGTPSMGNILAVGLLLLGWIIAARSLVRSLLHGKKPVQ
jgi:arabinofuranosyltransferase